MNSMWFTGFQECPECDLDFIVGAIKKRRTIMQAVKTIKRFKMQGRRITSHLDTRALLLVVLLNILSINCITMVDNP